MIEPIERAEAIYIFFSDASKRKVRKEGGANPGVKKNPDL
jgi:hypothetical protein